MVTNQQKWGRYCKAINYCIGLGYFIKPIDSENGNVKSIQVGYWGETDSCIATISLKPKKYTGEELFALIRDRIGYKSKIL